MSDTAQYLLLLVISVGLTFLVARLLVRAGEPFLQEVFQDEKVSRSVNMLLSVLFILVTLGVLAIISVIDIDTGDALQTLAFRLVSEDESLSPEKRVRLIAEIARASGTPHGMVAGQGSDLEAESRDVSAGELEQIHRLKTGALIIAAARCGAIIADASDAELVAVNEYAAQLGLLFQITDDLLDVTATAEALGKTPGKDQRAKKATYPALYGLEATQKHLMEAHATACASLENIDRPTELLHHIADFILQRQA